jgi:hypothetical protein
MKKYIKTSSDGDSHRYKTHKGEISLIYPCYHTMNKFEIYCIEGDLFDDVERFHTLGGVERRINELLN